MAAVEEGGRGSDFVCGDLAGQNTDEEGPLASPESPAASSDLAVGCSRRWETFGCYAAGVVVVVVGRMARGKSEGSRREDLICGRPEYQACIWTLQHCVETLESRALQSDQLKC